MWTVVYFISFIMILIVNNILQQADNFCNSIGILQQCALPSKFSNFDRNGSQTPQQQEGNCVLYIFLNTRIQLLEVSFVNSFFFQSSLITYNLCMDTCLASDKLGKVE